MVNLNSDLVDSIRLHRLVANRQAHQLVKHLIVDSMHTMIDLITLTFAITVFVAHDMAENAFQLLACGTELLKAYNELNDPQDQHQRWLDEEDLAKKGSETAMQMDHDYIRALEYGMPPTAGWGMGIDRLTQFITNQSTIKDTILFPAMRNQ